MRNSHRNQVFQHYVAMLARLGHLTAAAGYDLALAFIAHLAQSAPFRWCSACLHPRRKFIFRSVHYAAEFLDQSK
ncbi:MAG: hypothetical protein ACI93B_000593, partial [Yoonia sp.]